jgi:hypothetical protein
MKKAACFLTLVAGLFVLAAYVRPQLTLARQQRAVQSVQNRPEAYIDQQWLESFVSIPGLSVGVVALAGLFYGPSAANLVRNRNLPSKR